VLDANRESRRRGALRLCLTAAAVVRPAGAGDGGVRRPPDYGVVPCGGQGRAGAVQEKGSAERRSWLSVGAQLGTSRQASCGPRSCWCWRPGAAVRCGGQGGERACGSQGRGGERAVARGEERACGGQGRGGESGWLSGVRWLGR
jgi:hypothetical protein